MSSPLRPWVNYAFAAFFLLAAVYYAIVAVGEYSLRRYPKLVAAIIASIGFIALAYFSWRDARGRR